MNYTGRYSGPFDITVPLEFYERAVAVLGSEGSADAYLHGARLKDGRLLPRTQTAWEFLRNHEGFRKLLVQEQVDLLKPPPFVWQGGPGRNEFARRVRAA
ncbi:hypothetical protein [Methylocaldum sp.]|uniref:hypothetical protein n=1 Tax=Methylocaldum sp. TaxID=1969727 RepID=UPI002D666B61|nr:hypothetical protein [Methylocaldum sp.]HYE38210.1 hypothetical protein [Methylocaldum sp.]